MSQQGEPSGIAKINKLLALKAIKWYKILEDLALLVGIFKMVQLVVTDGLTKELCIGAHLVAKQVIRLRKKSGPLFAFSFLSPARHLPSGSRCSKAFHVQRGKGI